MTRTVKVANAFSNLKLSVTETIYSSAGEVFESTFANPIQENGNIKTFTFKGSKKIEFPNSGQISETYSAPSLIAPGPIIAGKKYFKVTILQNDTRDYCVQTLITNYSLNASITDIAAGNSLDIIKGCLIYVHGTSYTLNDIICTESELFALENNDVKIVANSSCKVYMFRAILKDS
jgi:hypothetical protein